MAAEAMVRGPIPDSVAAYYEKKTADILRKYGPGPRVHFHTGLWSDGIDPAWTQVEIQSRLVAAQEALLDHALRVWGAGLSGEVLDVGCGLGGSAILLAERLGARVEAITLVDRHVELVRRFARLAGVSERVRPRVADANQMDGPARFDAVMAIETSCYLDRVLWFSALRKVLRPPGQVYIIDCFLGRADVAAEFNTYWHTRIGTLGEYRHAAAGAGFGIEEVEDLSERAAGFWPLSMAWSQRALEVLSPGDPEKDRIEHSLAAHDRLHRTFLDGSIHYLRLTLSTSARQNLQRQALASKDR